MVYPTESSLITSHCCGPVVTVVFSLWLADKVDTSSVLFHLNKPGKQIIKERAHIARHIIRHLLCVINVGYRKGNAIAMYRSKLIAHKCKMEAVQIHTSDTSHI